MNQFCIQKHLIYYPGQAILMVRFCLSLALARNDASKQTNKI